MILPLRRHLLPVLALLAGLLLPAPATAQDDPRLQDAVRLAREGLGDSARAVTRSLLDATPVSSPLFPEILYTHGLVAGSLNDRRLALQRVTVEFSLSPWADDALLLLGQLDYAIDDPAGALRYFDRLLTDYPESPLRAATALWGARAAWEQRNTTEACRFASLGIAAGSDDVELRNQLAFQQQRCEATSPAPPAATPPPAPPPPPPPAQTGPVYRIQAAALQTQRDADQFAARLKALGFESVVVQEGRFYKVQAGPFRTRDEARAALPRIRERFGTGPFIVVVR